jgi:membrane-bound lytic murein transglycosylase F
MHARWAVLVLPMLGVATAEAHAQQPGIKKAGSAIERAAQARAAAKATSQFDDTFKKYGKRYFGPGFDWNYFKAQAMAESNLDPNAKSYVGARGLMQLMPTTYTMIQTKRPEFGEINDPEWNIAAGIMHDRYLWKLWSKDISEEERLNYMFSSYNAGEGTLARAMKVAQAQKLDQARWSNIESVAPTVPRWRYRETLGYVRKIDGYYGSLKKGTKGAAPVKAPSPPPEPSVVRPAPAPPVVQPPPA